MKPKFVRNNKKNFIYNLAFLIPKGIIFESCKIALESVILIQSRILN